MSMGPMSGIVGSAAGSPLAQTKGADPQRAQQDIGAQQRRIESDQKAESAAGIGEADGEDHEAAERDADGRRLWEKPPQTDNVEDAEVEDAEADATQQRQSKDATGESGNLLDLSG